MQTDLQQIESDEKEKKVVLIGSLLSRVELFPFGLYPLLQCWECSLPIFCQSGQTKQRIRRISINIDKYR